MKTKLLALVCLLLAALCASAQITIGVDLSTSGPGAALGIPERNAVTLAPDTIAGQKIDHAQRGDGDARAHQHVDLVFRDQPLDVLHGATGRGGRHLGDRKTRL